VPTEWTVRALTRATLPVLLALTLVELVGSGLVLAQFDRALQYPALLVLVPVTIGTAGNLGSILASRLSTAFHLGTLSFDPTDQTLAGNAVATVLLAASLFPVIGAGAWLLTNFLGGTLLPFATVVLIALVSGICLAVLAVVVSFLATYAAYRFGLDPDDVVIPVVTSTCDVLGVIVLFLVVRAIL
jgi:mgtE-like transporter